MKITTATYKEFDCRYRKEFLWLPKTIVVERKAETRWLEVASWVEQVYCMTYKDVWYPVRWVDEPPKEEK